MINLDIEIKEQFPINFPMRLLNINLPNKALIIEWITINFPMGLLNIHLPNIKTLMVNLLIIKLMVKTIIKS